MIALLFKKMAYIKQYVHFVHSHAVKPDLDLHLPLLSQKYCDPLDVDSGMWMYICEDCFKNDRRDYARARYMTIKETSEEDVQSCHICYVHIKQ